MTDFEFRDATPARKPVTGKGSSKVSRHEELPEKETAEETVPQLKTGTTYDDAELEAIFDQMMFEGCYTEDITLGKGRFKFTLRTRTGKEAKEVMTLLDGLSLKMGITVEGLRSIYNLAQSVVILNGKDLSGETLDRRVDVLDSLPTPVISALMTHLIKFDLKTEAAVRHGEENF